MNLGKLFIYLFIEISCSFYFKFFIQISIFIFAPIFTFIDSNSYYFFTSYHQSSFRSDKVKFQLLTNQRYSFICSVNFSHIQVYIEKQMNYLTYKSSLEKLLKNKTNGQNNGPLLTFMLQFLN